MFINKTTVGGFLLGLESPYPWAFDQVYRIRHEFFPWTLKSNQKVIGYSTIITPGLYL